MEVGVLTTGFPRREGDLAGNFVFFCCRALRARGLGISVVAPHTPGTPVTESIGGVPVRRFRYFYPSSLERVAYQDGTPANLRRSGLAWLGLPPFALSFWLHARRLARRSDVLHAHWIPSGLVALACAPFGRRPPVVVSVWGSDLALARLPVLGRLTMSILRRASAVIAVSEAMKRELVERGLREERVDVIPTAVTDLRAPAGDRDEVRRGLGLPAGAPVVLYLGRLATVKGPEHFIEAARLAQEDAPDARFVVVGDGHLRPELEARAAAAGLKDRVVFAGHVRHDEVGRWLSSADVFVLPSLSEGQPHALLEALAFGLPVVASAVGGVPEVVTDEVNGTLAAPGDAPALARGILALLRDPGKRQAFGAAGRKIVEDRRLTWDRFAADVSGVYERVLSAPQ